MAYCFSEFPLYIIIQKYAIDWIAVHVYKASSTSIPSPCDPNITDSERYLGDKVQSLTSIFQIVESAVFGVPALVVTVLLGAGSDRFGRR